MSEGLVVGTFADPDTLLRALVALRRERFRIHDVFSPHPVHGVDDAMGLRRTRLPFVTLVASLVGLSFAIAFQFYANVLDWPLDVGGKPNNSTLAFIPICFELTVLSGGLVTVLALFVRARLYPGKREQLVAPGVTDDTFAIAVRAADDIFEARRTVELLEQLGAVSIETWEER
jgi:ActD protein